MKKWEMRRGRKLLAKLENGLLDSGHKCMGHLVAEEAEVRFFQRVPKLTTSFSKDIPNTAYKRWLVSCFLTVPPETTPQQAQHRATFHHVLQAIFKQLNSILNPANSVAANQCGSAWTFTFVVSFQRVPHPVLCSHREQGQTGNEHLVHWKFLPDLRTWPSTTDLSQQQLIQQASSLHDCNKMCPTPELFTNPFD